jgi:hypothetical protein
MSHAEFVYWQAYGLIEPYGDRRGDYQAALICTTLGNIHRGPKTSALQLRDFLLDFTPRRRLTTPQQQMEFFKAMTLAVGGTVISRKGNTEGAV